MKKATFVLIHGAWMGAWTWSRVRPALQANGHEVFTPTLTGLGERAHLARPDVDLHTHIHDVINVLLEENLRNVILVGHSYAGMVITGVGAKMPERLSRLVYLDAFLPEDGNCLNDYLAGAAQYGEIVDKHGNGWRLPFFGSMTLEMHGITDPRDLDWMTPLMCDQPYKTFVQPLRVPPHVKTEPPSVYIRSSERAHFVAAAIRAQLLGFEVIEMPGAGHDVMITRPKELIDVLLSIA